ncbi:hypothetical protein [Corallococcus terminator]|uniref:Uncharacterized protein n=1 Tax=Corallococcus terminator TaxID=2316733 RepID=A0A3A8IAF5_9BACT|nr:hypothetical protein [Corallococcus terminator]RKG80467.1 hypothetical protein D7V88_27500 [Corallococcus terminator]
MAMASRVFLLATWVAAAGAGLGLAWWTAPALPSDETPRRLERLEGELRALRLGLESAPRRAPPAVAGLELPSLREELRQLLREEIQAAKANAPATASGERPEPLRVSLPRENPEALAKIQQLVDQSIAAKRWGDPERGEFILLRDQLTAQQHRDILLKLSVAINNQQLRVTTQGPPF